MREYDRSAEDVGNVQMLEHVNVTVPDPDVATLFYVSGLGLTRDPYIDFGSGAMWVNVGDQQFHLPRSDAQVLRGTIGVVVPDLNDLQKRLERVAKVLAATRFDWKRQDDHIAICCPWGNHLKAYGPGHFPHMDLGLPYVDMAVPQGAAAGIARFYENVMGCPVTSTPTTTRVTMGYNQQLIFTESESAQADYDGHHIAIYVSDFSGPHRFLKERGLITEESDRYQYRFQTIVDPNVGDEPLFELEHEVRALSHPMYRRHLVNRNPAISFRSYRKGSEVFTPA